MFSVGSEKSFIFLLKGQWEIIIEFSVGLGNPFILLLRDSEKL